MAQTFTKKFEGEWKISTPAYPLVFKNIVTAPFSPLPDESIKFCFYAFYQKIKGPSRCPDLSLFKLKLVKLCSTCISSTLKLVLDVKAHYSDGSLFHEYNKRSVNVDDTNEITFEDVNQPYHTESLSQTPHYEKMKSETLVIKCKMTFHDDHQSSHFMHGVQMSNPNKYLDLFRNFKSMYHSCVFSDFVFNVGDKSLPAHKVVLAAHSPVFKNMLTQDFLESKTSTVTITDATPEIFDSFLMYLYSGEIKDKSWDSLKALYHLADKYDVRIFKNECIETASSILSVDIICDVLKVAYTYSDSRLKTAAKIFAVQHLKDIVLREDWKELGTSHPIIVHEITVEFLSK